jgi:hypothetical protein
VEIWGGLEGLERHSDIGEDGDDIVDAVDAKDSWGRQEGSKVVGKAV